MLIAAFMTVGMAICQNRSADAYDCLRAQLFSYGHSPHEASPNKDRTQKTVSYGNEIRPISYARKPTSVAANENFHIDGTRAVSELRITSGLTVKQIAEVLKVSSKTIFNWQNGGVISASNMQALGSFLDVVRFADRGEGSLNKAMLLTTGNGTNTCFELLKNGQFDDARALAGAGRGRIDSKKFLMANKPIESAGEQLIALAENTDVTDFEEENNFRTTQFDLIGDDWS